MFPPRDLVHLSSLLASRLCHDLVNPVGALSTGLDVLGEESDPDMQEHAISLIKESTARTVAILTYARMAFGSSGGWEGDIDLGEARPLAEGYFAHQKPDLAWQAPGVPLPKWKVRAIMNALIVTPQIAVRAGSTISVTLSGERAEIVVEGPRLKVSDDLMAAFGGTYDSLQAKETPAYFARMLAEAGGEHLSAEAEGEERFVISIGPVN